MVGRPGGRTERERVSALNGRGASKSDGGKQGRSGSGSHSRCVCVCVSELLRASSSWMRSGTRKSFKMRKTQYDKHVGNTNGDCVDETQM